MRLKTITAHELSEALSALDVPVGVALKDPVRCMRFASTASEGAILAALKALLVDVPDLRGDELRLFACGVMSRVLVHVRNNGRQRGGPAKVDTGGGSADVRSS